MSQTGYQPARRVDVRSALRAHRLLVVTCALIGLAAGIGASLLLPASYTATTSVLLRPLDGNPYSPNAQGSDLTNLETEAQVVASDVIEDEVREALGIDPGQSLASGLRITVAPNTQVIQIGYAADDPDGAEAVAGAFAESFLTYRETRRDDFTQSTVADIEERIDALTEQLTRLRRAGRANEDPEVRAIGGQLLNLRLQAGTLESAETSGGEVIAEAAAERSGLSLTAPLGGLAGALLGLVLGAVLAIVRERSADVLRSIDDVEHLGVAVLGVHQAGGAGRTARSGGGEPGATYDVAFLAGTILNRRAGVPASVAVASVSAGVPVGGFARELAEVLAHGRPGVVLIDGASSRPSEGPGLSDLLMDGTSPLALLGEGQEAGQDDAVVRLGVGRDPVQGGLLYASTRLRETLEETASRYPWVVLEGPATETVAGRALVGACGYWMPVVALGQATRDDLERALTWSQATGVSILGVVALDAPRARARRAGDGRQADG